MSAAEVRSGPWLCENTLVRDCDSINVSQRTLLVARSVAGSSFFGRSRKILLAASQFFAFLHSLGHLRPMHSVAVPIDVRCYSDSDITVRRSEVTVRAMNRHSLGLQGPAQSRKPREKSMLTKRFDEAFRYAHRLHRTQARKGTPVPYISHLMAVAALVVEHGGNEDQTIGALLHDAAED
jgi:hypothetical protein